MIILILNLLDELFRYLKENGLSPSPVENVGTKNVVNINGKNVYIQNCKSRNLETKLKKSKVKMGKYNFEI